MILHFYLLVLALVMPIGSDSLSIPPVNKSTKLPAPNIDTSIQSEKDGKRMPRGTEVSNESTLEKRWWPEFDAVVGTAKAYLETLVQSMPVNRPPPPLQREVSLVPTARSIPTKEAMSLQDPMHPDRDEKFKLALKMVTDGTTHSNLAIAKVDTSTYAQVLNAQAELKEGPERHEASTKAKVDVAAYGTFKLIDELHQLRADMVLHEKSAEGNQARHLPSL